MNTDKRQPRNRCSTYLAAAFAALPVAALAEMPGLSELGAGWNAIPTDGLCSTGTPYRFHVRPGADNSRLLIYFQGGGACWFGQQCDLTAQPNTHFPFADMPENDPAMQRGVFALDNPDNPFADWSMVFLPYCTGDVHVGAGERVYTYTKADGAEVSVPTQHVGYSNVTTVLDWVYGNYTAPERVLVTGSSAGAIGSSFHSGFIAEHYDDIPVVLMADSAGGYNSPNLPVTFRSWDTASVLPDWPGYEGKTNENLTFEDFYIASATHADNLTIAQFNTMNDQVQVNFTLLIGDPPGSFSIPERLLHHYAEIEDAVETFHTYTAGGAAHTIVATPLFYTYEVEGVRFADWMAGLANGENVGDISCVDEAGGCTNAPD